MANGVAGAEEADLIAAESTDEEISEELTPEELAEARRYSLLIEWSPEDDAYIVTGPELPNVRTHGTTHQDAVEMGEEVIATYLWSLRRHGQPLPPPRFFYGDEVSGGS